MIGGVGPQELVLVGGILVLLFGARKIPELARGLGQGIRVFKSEVKEIKKNVEVKQPEKEV